MCSSITQKKKGDGNGGSFIKVNITQNYALNKAQITYNMYLKNIFITTVIVQYYTNFMAMKDITKQMKHTPTIHKLNMIL